MKIFNLLRQSLCQSYFLYKNNKNLPSSPSLSECSGEVCEPEKQQIKKWRLNANTVVN